ncbi:MAG: hypothetical protein EA403_03150 [Spirochaetaceae bacterium]|nr:MAG: hypothetical protein EA403_03150 [Spirochaetaceae bacterium]
MENERTHDGSHDVNTGVNMRDDAVKSQRIREQALSKEVQPFVLQQFRERVDPADAATAVADRFPIDQHKAYRWTAIIYDELERSRRLIARIFATVMWLGALLIVIPVVGAITGRVTETAPIAVIQMAIGVVLLVGGIVGGLNAHRFTASR